jgi:hypothetical protein
VSRLAEAAASLGRIHIADLTTEEPYREGLSIAIASAELGRAHLASL